MKSAAGDPDFFDDLRGDLCAVATRARDLKLAGWLMVPPRGQRFDVLIIDDPIVSSDEGHDG